MFLIWLTVRPQPQITTLWVFAIVFIILSHPSFEKGHSLVNLVLTGIDDSLLHLSVDQYKIKLPFGPICHHLAVHSASSNYCNSWSFKKKKSQRCEHQTPVSRLWFFWSNVTHLQKLQIASKATQGRGNVCHSCLPFCAFSLLEGCYSKAESHRWKDSIGPYTSIMFNKFCVFYSNK